MRRLLAILILMSLPSLAAEPREIQLKMADGTALKLTLYSAAKKGPGVLLLHQCNQTQKGWAPLAESLAANGITVLTMDYRGFGESEGPRYADASQDEKGRMIREVWPRDIDIALDYLRRQPTVDAAKLGAGGASCGVDESVRLAERNPKIRSLALLSGNTDRDHRVGLQKLGRVPLLLVVADDDGATADVMKWMASYSANPQNRLIEFKTGGHGAELFQPHPDVIASITDWYWITLAGHKKALPGEAPAASKDLTYWRMLDEPDGARKTMQKLADARRHDANVTVIPEAIVNLMGYERLAGGNNAGAIEIFTLNVAQYPHSANVYDSLGDAYLAAGDKERAKDSAEKAIAHLESDSSINDATRQAIRASAEQKIAAVAKKP